MLLEWYEPRADIHSRGSAQLNRRAALVMLNDKIKVEMSGEAERQGRTKPNKRLHPTGMSLSLIENLSLAQLSPGG